MELLFPSRIAAKASEQTDESEWTVYAIVEHFTLLVVAVQSGHRWGGESGGGGGGGGRSVCVSGV